MLILGESRSLLDIISNSYSDLYTICNYTGYIQSIKRLDCLLPDMDFNRSPYDMDIAYTNNIMMNDYNFYEFIRNIIYPLYKQFDVYVCINTDQYNQYISIMNEFLTDFISTRYGYNHCMVINKEDIYWYNRDDYGFSKIGMSNLNIDIPRFESLHKMYTGEDLTNPGGI